MIQGLLAGVVEERKLSIQSGGLLSDAHAPFLSSTGSAIDIASTLPSSASCAASPLQMVATASSPSTASEGPQQNLRCPRCDSSNTKFCYYNNYNLTQPRHFCKTCRRYWTKGGALRNVPIGGGCRKAKPAPAISAAAVKSAAAGGKPTKPVFSMDRAGLGVEPVRFPQANSTSHLLALLRAGGVGGGGGVLQYPNHNPLPALNGIRIKEEAMVGESAAGGLALPGLSLDPFGMGSLWRNDGQFQYLQPQQSNAAFGDVAVGIQELYHRLRSPATSATTTTAYCSDQSSVRNGWSTAATSSLEPTGAMATGAVGGLDPVVGGELGFWNAGLMSWSDMSTSN